MLPGSSSTQENVNQPEDELLTAESTAFKTALVCMPFGSTRHPSIQLGLLSSIARTHGFPVDCFHFNLNFAHQIGQQLYLTLADHRGKQLGDWLFSIQAFGARAPDRDGELLKHAALGRLWAATAAQAVPDELRHDPAHLFLRLRDKEVPVFLDKLLQTVPWSEYRVVAFTSSFQQSVAAFALARHLKDSFPHLITVFGGANFDGEMGLELTRTVDVIDYSVIGEGDVAFLNLLQALQQGRDPGDVPGVATKRNGTVAPPVPQCLVRNLDELPLPSYEAFYAQRAALVLPGGEKWEDDGVPFESARGCWWGEKRHCTFCGLNSRRIAFRAKSIPRTIAELEELTHRHGMFRFVAVDNIIEPGYIDGLFTRLAEQQADYDLFYEVKANLSREQIRTLKRGGLNQVQPGIESLSSDVLRLMDKGTTGIQNVNALRWALYYGTKVFWHMLYGFPGEKPSHYEQQAELIPHLTHLQPPHNLGRIWMERYSPIFVDRETYPAKRVVPEMSYRFVYPEDCALEKIAYFFEYELEDTLPDEVYEPMRQAVKRWQLLWQRPSRPHLIFRYSPRHLNITDGRNPDNLRALSYQGALCSAVYLACSDKPQSPQSVARHLGRDASISTIEEILEGFVQTRVMMREDNRFLSLALPAIEYR